MLRLPFSLLLATAVTLGLFYLMHFMISQGRGGLERFQSYSVVDFIRLKEERQVRTKQRVLPPKPPLPKKPPPPPPPLSVAEQAPVSMKLAPMEMPRFTPPGVRGGPFLGTLGQVGAGSTDAELIPLVKIAPRYPRRAALAGKEGWVKLEFTVTETGAVKDVTVVEAHPRGLFDRAAKRAILKWKFKPKVVEGKPVARRAVQVIEFKLEKRRR